MSNVSEDYKQQKLHSLYLEVAEFAQQYHDTHLGNLGDILENPHITRLINAFGLLTSHLKMVVDENSTQFISALFDILYPHYNAHIPSIATIAISLNQKHGASINLPAGRLMEMQVGKNIYKFQTSYDTEILPVKITQAVCYLDQSIVNTTSSTLSICCTSLDKFYLSKLGLKKIRFLIKGMAKEEYSIYQNIMVNLEAVIIRAPEDHNNFITLNKDCIKKVGFDCEEGIFPYPANSFSGYRLITEFFLFPEKFLFFDLMLDEINLAQFQNSIEICFNLQGLELVDVVCKDNFILNATPIINLFSAESDPVEIKANIFEYPLIINENPTKNYEIYSVNQVTININNKEYVAQKSFDLNSDKLFSENNFKYSTKQRNTILNGSQDEIQYISFVDDEGCLFADTKSPKYFYINAFCSDGNFPSIHYLANSTDFRFLENTMPLAKIQCISSPTAKYKIGKNKDQKWKLIAHLSLNYLNIINNNNGKELLREIISMYSTDNNTLSQLLLKNIIDVKVFEKIARTNSLGLSQFYKGNLIEIWFDCQNLSAGLVYLFLNVLEYFFATYCSINSFIQLVAKTKSGHIIYKGTPKNGKKCLI
jgi:type VI secretion system protein ImpG